MINLLSNETFYESVVTDPNSISIANWNSIDSSKRLELIKFVADKIQIILTSRNKDGVIVTNKDKPKFKNFGTFIKNVCNAEELELACQSVGKDALMNSDPWTLQEIHSRGSDWAFIFQFRRTQVYDKSDISFEEFKANGGSIQPPESYEDKYKRISGKDSAIRTGSERRWLKRANEDKRTVIKLQKAEVSK